MVHLHNGILFDHKKKEILPFMTAWMDLEIMMLCEVSQLEKDKYNTIWSHLYVGPNGQNKRTNKVETDSQIQRKD